MERKKLIEVKNVTKEYVTGTKTNALKGVSLDVYDGDYIIIKGESGCGKTTLLNIMSGLDTCTSGDVLFDGKSIVNVKSSSRTDLFRKIGFVFQNSTQFLIPYIDAMDNVAKGLEPLGIKEKDVEKKSTETLAEVGLGDRIHHLPSQLSGGECQRVAIARAIIKNPMVVFADEPTGNLDSENASKILSIFKELNEQGKTIVMVTHSEKIEVIGKKIVYMKDGLIEGR